MSPYSTSHKAPDVLCFLALLRIRVYSFLVLTFAFLRDSFALLMATSAHLHVPKCSRLSLRKPFIRLSFIDSMTCAGSVGFCSLGVAACRTTCQARVPKSRMRDMTRHHASRYYASPIWINYRKGREGLARTGSSIAWRKPAARSPLLNVAFHMNVCFYAFSSTIFVQFFLTLCDM